MDNEYFEVWCEQFEFAFKSTKKTIKQLWSQLYDEFDIDDENIGKMIETVYKLGLLEGA